VLVRIAQGVGGWRKSVPEGPDESSPARSAGFSVFKTLSVPDGTIDEMLAIVEPHPKPKAECFYRPCRDGRVFVRHFPVLRAGLLSLSPSGTSPHRPILDP
jgi:hypothetical protein